MIFVIMKIRNKYKNITDNIYIKIFLNKEKYIKN